MKNNIFDSGGGPCLRDAGGDITSHDNNIYHDPDGGTLVVSAGTTHTASNIVADYEATAITAAPVHADGEGADFSQESSSPAIDAGENLGAAYDDGLAATSAWPGSVVTLDRNLCGSGWDIGAYEYGTPPDPPPMVAPVVEREPVAHRAPAVAQG